MTDPRTLAQREGPEAMAHLVDKVLVDSKLDLTHGAHLAIIAAARKLAEPEPVMPKWPTGKLWALFEPTHGWFVCVNNIPQGAEPYHLDRPCRVVPANAAVLTREEAEDVLSILNGSEVRYWPSAQRARAALRREREGK